MDTEVGSPETLDLSPWPPREFWLQVAPGGYNIAEYASLEEMTADAQRSSRWKGQGCS